jgi:hypothetical protein
MPGPTQPGFYPRGPQQMQGNPPPGITEDDYYGPPTPEMRQGPPLEQLPSDLWGTGRRSDTIDLMNPEPQPEGERQAAIAQRSYKGQPGKAFIDRVEGGYAVVELPGSEQTITLPAQAGWKEGMFIEPPRTAENIQQHPRRRRPVP